MGTINFTIKGQIAFIELDNPAKLNALNLKMLKTLDAHLEAIEDNSDIGCVLLSAVPAKAFCAGADIKEWSALSPQEFATKWVRMGHRIFDRFARLSAPTIAAIEAPAMGGGVELIAACDLRVMSARANISLPETGIGIIPGWSGTQRLARLLPEPMIKSMMLFGKKFTAAELAALGFVEMADAPLDRAKELANAALERSREANIIAKLMLHAGIGEDKAASIEALGGGFAAGDEEKARRVEAFLTRKRS